VIELSERIFCYHDDDPVAKLAFEVYSFDGKKIATQTTKEDVLFYKFNSDRTALALGFVGGVIRTYDSALHATGEFRVSSQELVDLSVYKDHGDLRLAALGFNRERGQELIIAEKTSNSKDFKILEALPRSPFVNQVEFSQEGQAVMVYGNNLQGQILGRYEFAQGHWSLAWEKKDPYYADYSHSIRVMNSYLLAGFEKNKGDRRVSKLLLIDSLGQLKTDLDFETKEGAYLVQFGGDRSGSSIIIGTDDKKLSSYQLQLSASE
jgi:hypothetical protein